MRIYKLEIYILKKANDLRKLKIYLANNFYNFYFEIDI